MIYFIFAVILVVSTFITFTIGKKVSKKKIYEGLNKGTGRMGIIRFHDSWSDAHGIIEVEEVDTAGDRTKVFIHKVIPDRNSKVTSESSLLKSWGGNDWVISSQITWYDSNSQKIRDAKLKSILNES